MSENPSKSGAGLDQAGAADAPPTPAQQLASAMRFFVNARLNQIAHEGTDPGVTAVNLSAQGVKLEALIGLLADVGVFTREQYQVKAAETSVHFANLIEQQKRPSIITVN